MENEKFAGGKWVRPCPRKSWELISPDVTFCPCGMFSPLLLGFRAPFAPDTRVTDARASNIHGSLSSAPSSNHLSFPSIFSSLLWTSTLFRPAIRHSSLRFSMQSYDFIRAQSPFLIYRYSSISTKQSTAIRRRFACSRR